MGLTKEIEKVSKEFEKWINRFINHPEEVYDEDVTKEMKKMFLMYRLQGLNENITYFPEKELNEIFPVNLPCPYSRSSKPLKHSVDGTHYSDTSIIPDGDTNIFIGNNASKDLIKCEVRSPIDIPKEIIWLATFVRVKWNKEWKKGLWRDITNVYQQWFSGYSGFTGSQGQTGYVGHTGYQGMTGYAGMKAVQTGYTVQVYNNGGNINRGIVVTP